VGEATSLVWAPGSKAELTWIAASGATLHKVLRGVLADLPNLLTTAPDGCERWTGSGTTTGAVLGEDPSTVAGSLYWYLVIGANGTIEGSAGSTGAGPRNATSTGGCP
jgi:hypothetical protein